jgi:hypothetical protein
MTSREFLNRRMRWIGGSLYLGFAVFAGGMIAGGLLGQPAWSMIGIPGFALFFCAIVLGQSGGLRCLLCQTNLGPILMTRGGVSIDNRLHFCPYCGCDLDRDVISDPKPIPPPTKLA